MLGALGLFLAARRYRFRAARAGAEQGNLSPDEQARLAEILGRDDDRPAAR
jgi:hypothetical protein